MYVEYKMQLKESFIEANKDTLNWYAISKEQRLTEEFIEKYKDKVDWYYISAYQKLSEPFIEKYKDKLCWENISMHQKLSEAFIEKFQDRVNWDYICEWQTLSEDFIERHKNKVAWHFIFQCQNLSDTFIQDRIGDPEYGLANKVCICSPNKVDNRPLVGKMQDMRAYARRYNLEIENDYLYAFRQHDKWNRGKHNPTIFYDKPGVYRDWKCDLDAEDENSYGLGIFFMGNVKVRIHVKDWGIWVKDTGKARVWAFELLETRG